jgi:beta-glucosidase
MKSTEQIEVSVTVTNSGKYEGEEIVQLYLRDKVGSIVRPMKELKDFKKINLKSGQSQTIRFVINKEKLSFFAQHPADNQQLQWVAEPGDFEVMIGASSQDIRLKDNFELVQ